MKTSQMIINNGFGSIEYSKMAIDEYKKQTNTNCLDKYFECSRFDPVMIDIIKKIGTAAYEKNYDVGLVDIIDEYKPYIVIHEYDGQESWEYNFEKYRLDKIKEIIDSHVDLQTKMDKINEILQHRFIKMDTIKCM